MRVSAEILRRAENLIGKVARVQTESRETALGTHFGKVDEWEKLMILWSKNTKGPQPLPPESYVHGLHGKRELVIANLFRIPCFPVTYH